ncbi:MaoC family dehydratase [Sulfitobacter sp. S190]|nr:MaoC family dehydratase [Sulfitobacter sp. S190]
MTREALAAAVGTTVARSDWERVDQDRIDAFAQVSGDHQFIHTDPRRAAATPFGGTIAHGMLSLSVLVGMASRVLPPVAGQRAVVNYGFDRVRFIAPVRAGARVRGQFDLAQVTERGRGALMLRYAAQALVEGADRPALRADWLLLYQFET